MANFAIFNPLLSPFKKGEKALVENHKNAIGIFTISNKHPHSCFIFLIFLINKKHGSLTTPLKQV